MPLQLTYKIFINLQFQLQAIRNNYLCEIHKYSLIRSNSKQHCFTKYSANFFLIFFFRENATLQF